MCSDDEHKFQYEKTIERSKIVSENQVLKGKTTIVVSDSDL